MPAPRLLTWTLAAGVALAALPGCSTKPPAAGVGAADRKAEDPWPRAVAEFRRENDLPAARRVLEQLRTDLANNGDPKYQPASLAADREKALQVLLRLTDREVAEVRTATYTGLDAHHLAECYYLRDIARSLGVTGLPPERQARAAFDWVTRQLPVQPWVTASYNGQRQLMPPAPPSLAMVRGAGSGLERAYVFLGLLTQLGLDGCLVGPPESAQRGWSYAAAAKPNAPPRGPFWAAGVRVGPHIYLYDCWRGEAVPGPATNAGGVATLAQVRAEPAFLKPWRDDLADPWDVPAADVAASVPFLAVPLSSVAPRFERFEVELRADAPGVRLFTDAVALQTRFAAETKLAVAAWNPPGEGFSATRALASYVPPGEGGMAELPDLAAQFRNDLSPPDLFSLPDALRPRPPAGPGDAGDPGVPEATGRLRALCVGLYRGNFVTPPSPRERVQRGQFAEVTPLLIQRRASFLAGVERLRTDRGRDDQLAQFAAEAKELYTKLVRARVRESADPAGAAAANAAVEEFWRTRVGAVTALVDVAASEAGAAEATFLIALSLHEQAERAQLVAEVAAAKPGAGADRARGNAAAAWAEAAGWWNRYAPYAAQQGRFYPPRPALAAKLSAAAQAKSAP